MSMVEDEQNTVVTTAVVIVQEPQTPIPEPFRTLLNEQRRAHIAQANALSRALGMQEICPCCGKKAG